eukprot:gene12165-13420_t
MSWNPFNKLIAPKKSSIKAVDDAEFDAQVQQVVVAENLSKKLYKNTKKCLESSISLSKLEQRIAYELFNSSKLIKDSEHLVEHAEMLKDVAAQIEDSQQQRDAIIRQTFVRPIKGLCEKFPTIHSAVKRREQSQQDYIKYFSRKEKLSRDPNSMQSGKFDANEKYLDRTRSDHERRTKQLSEDIPKFLHQKWLEPVHRCQFPRDLIVNAIRCQGRSIFCKVQESPRKLFQKDLPSTTMHLPVVFCTVLVAVAHCKPSKLPEKRAIFGGPGIGHLLNLQQHNRHGQGAGNAFSHHEFRNLLGKREFPFDDSLDEEILARNKRFQFGMTPGYRFGSASTASGHSNQNYLSQFMRHLHGKRELFAATEE